MVTFVSGQLVEYMTVNYTIDEESYVSGENGQQIERGCDVVVNS